MKSISYLASRSSVEYDRIERMMFYRDLSGDDQSQQDAYDEYPIRIQMLAEAGNHLEVEDESASL